MKRMMTTLAVLMCLWLAAPGVSSARAAAGKDSTSKVYSALAELPVAGRTLNVKIYLNGFSSPDDLKSLNQLLANDGPDAMLKALRKMKSRGKIQQDGTVGFYDLKLIVSTPTATGRQAPRFALVAGSRADALRPVHDRLRAAGPCLVAVRDAVLPRRAGLFRNALNDLCWRSIASVSTRFSKMARLCGCPIPSLQINCQGTWIIGKSQQQQVDVAA